VQPDKLARPKRHNRAHGTGTLSWQTKRERWQAKASVMDGRRTKCFSALQFGGKGAARQKAEEWLQDTAVDKRRGNLVLLGGSTPELEKAISDYLEMIAGVTDETKAQTGTRLRKLKDACKPGAKIADLDNTVLGKFFTSIEQQHSPKEYGHTRAAVRALITHYQFANVIPRRQVDWKLIKAPRVQPRRHNLFDVLGSPDGVEVVDERVRFLSAAQDGLADCSCHPTGERLVAMFSLQANEALGPGEVLGTAWSDIPPDFSTISINRTSHEVERLLEGIAQRLGRRDLGALAKEFMSGRTRAKRGARVRVLILSEESRTALRAWRAQAPADALLVFPAADGGPERLQHVDALCERLCAAAGLPHHVPTDFRHTAITIALAYTRQADGVSVADVSHWAGHADVTTTLNQYDHELPRAPGLIAALARLQRNRPEAYENSLSERTSSARWGVA
jgi:integrase